MCDSMVSKRSRAFTRVVVLVAASLCIFASTSHAREDDDTAAVTEDEASSRAGDRALLSDWESRVYSQSEHAVSVHFPFFLN